MWFYGGLKQSLQGFTTSNLKSQKLLDNMCAVCMYVCAISRQNKGVWMICTGCRSLTITCYTHTCISVVWLNCLMVTPTPSVVAINLHRLGCGSVGFINRYADWSSGDHKVFYRWMPGWSLYPLNQYCRGEVVVVVVVCVWGGGWGRKKWKYLSGYHSYLMIHVGDDFQSGCWK